MQTISSNQDCDGNSAWCTAKKLERIFYIQETRCTPPDKDRWYL